jgi:hypothetical protein
MRRVAAVLAFLALSVPFLCAQSVPGQDADGRHVEADFFMKDASVGSLSLRAAFTLEGFLDLGLAGTVDFSPVDSLPSRRIDIAVFASAAVLRQDARMPLSFTLWGSYGKSSFLSDSLTAQALTRTGTGFTVEAELARDFGFSSTLFLHLGLVGEYDSITYTTEPTVGGGSSASTVVENPSNYRFGLRTGLLFGLADGIAMYVGASATLDKDLRVEYGPVLRLSSWDVKPKS